MKYSFKDIYSEAFYDNSRVAFVTGPYNIFNNIVSDIFKARCTPQNAAVMDADTMKEFGLEVDETNITLSNYVNFETFLNVVISPNISGRWFCNVDYGTLNKKNKERLMEYVRNPNENGVLVVYSMDWKDYKYLLNNRLISSSSTVNIIQLSWPYKDILNEILINMFTERNATVDARGLELIVLRMSDSYDEYTQIVDKICLENLPEGFLTMKPSDLPVITYDMVFESLKGVENYVLDDFIQRLTEPLTSDKLRLTKKGGNTQAFRMMKILIDEYTAKGLLNKIKYKINDFIEFRQIINDGIIPILVNYSVGEAKEMLGDEHKFFKLSDYQFRKMAKIASKTSLIDWLYMKLMLNRVGMRSDDTYYEHVLFALLSRSVMYESRINNAIKVDDALDLDLNYIDDMEYGSMVELQKVRDLEDRLVDMINNANKDEVESTKIVVNIIIELIENAKDVSELNEIDKLLDDECEMQRIFKMCEVETV